MAYRTFLFFAFGALLSCGVSHAESSAYQIKEHVNLNHPSDTIINPLALFSAQWNDKKFQELNTAQNAEYLSQEEKNVIWVLNQIKFAPALFLKTVLMNPASRYRRQFGLQHTYYASLIGDIKKLQPIKTPLTPDQMLFESARCHALQSGIAGYVGHQRTDKGCKEYYNGECCDYGHSEALDIIMSLLVDENVTSLGHRKICLSTEYNTIGVAIRPHKTYGHNTVMDFR